MGNDTPEESLVAYRSPNSTSLVASSNKGNVRNCPVSRGERSRPVIFLLRLANPTPQFLEDLVFERLHGACVDSGLKHGTADRPSELDAEALTHKVFEVSGSDGALDA
jgi:hypothetical protein